MLEYKFGNTFLLIICFIILGVVFFSAETAYSLDNPTCTKNGVTLQILGSGGPFAGDQRASSGYLIWVNEHPYIMVDAGVEPFCACSKQVFVLMI